MTIKKNLIYQPSYLKSEWVFVLHFELLCVQMKLLNLLLLSPDLTTYIFPQILCNQSKLYAIVKVLILRKQIVFTIMFRHNILFKIFQIKKRVMSPNLTSFYFALSQEVFLFLRAVIATIAKLKYLSSVWFWLSTFYPHHTKYCAMWCI